MAYPCGPEAAMSEYVAGLCGTEGAGIAPFETLTIEADTDEEAIRQAEKWRVDTVSSAPLDRRIWLQVLCGGKAIYSKEIGRF
jgi:hypothetical protein